MSHYCAKAQNWHNRNYRATNNLKKEDTFISNDKENNIVCKISYFGCVAWGILLSRVEMGANPKVHLWVCYGVQTLHHSLSREHEILHHSALLIIPDTLIRTPNSLRQKWTSLNNFYQLKPLLYLLYCLSYALEFTPELQGQTKLKTKYYCLSSKIGPTLQHEIRN